LSVFSSYAEMDPPGLLIKAVLYLSPPSLLTLFHWESFPNCTPRLMFLTGVKLLFLAIHAQHAPPCHFSFQAVTIPSVGSRSLALASPYSFPSWPVFQRISLNCVIIRAFPPRINVSVSSPRKFHPQSNTPPLDFFSCSPFLFLLQVSTRRLPPQRSWASLQFNRLFASVCPPLRSTELPFPLAPFPDQTSR